MEKQDIVTAMNASDEYATIRITNGGLLNINVGNIGAIEKVCGALAGVGVLVHYKDKETHEYKVWNGPDASL